MEKKVFKAYKKDKLANLICEQGFSYNNASMIIRNKDVKVDGVRVKNNIEVEKDAEITIFYENNQKFNKFKIIYEDENIFLLDKCSGIEVEGKDGLEGALNAIAVHRLDRNTEGLMVMAKNGEAEKSLLKGFKDRTIEKKYWAEVVGPTDYKGEVYSAYLIKDKDTSYVKVVASPCKGAEKIMSTFKTLSSNPSSSIVECGLITGKTHQLRAHLKFLGHPIIGDGKYGKNEDNKKFKANRQRLYCVSLRFAKLDYPLDYLSGREFKSSPKFMQKFKN